MMEAITTKSAVFFALGHQLRKSLMSEQLFLSGVFELGTEGGKKRENSSPSRASFKHSPNAIVSWNFQNYNAIID